jgi:hypothetical protein
VQQELRLIRLVLGFGGQGAAKKREKAAGGE